ncbi:FAD-binding oxidoreductase [Patulibacter americanus]|uniref:FAD-binding oxidoreductase n=1 Tax=Patulibacter americanus TaxID=588672 RepID=UPI00041360BA|nr:FAD-binding oxidoreductase [Patulibacter americanus]
MQLFTSMSSSPGPPPIASATDPAAPTAAPVAPAGLPAAPPTGREAFPVSWSGWADPDHVEPLGAGLLELLRGAFGVTGETVATPGDPDAVVLPAPALPAAAREALTGIVGDDHVRDDHATRLAHAAGKSTLDLLAARAGRLPEAPDAVVTSGSPEETQAVVEACAALRIAVVPFGGGTSVVGGLRALRGDLDGVVALDLRRLDRLVRVSPEDRIATLQAGLLLPQADALLAVHGLTLGHLPQSYERASVGGCAATRSSGQASSGYGRFDAMVVGLRVATPSGELRVAERPPNAAGPDLLGVLLGSEGTLGVITEVTVRVQPVPAAARYEGWTLPSFAAGAAALRDLARSGERPTVMRMSDEVESAMRLATVTQDDGATAPRTEPVAGQCLVVVGWDGPDGAAVNSRAERAGRILAAHGGVPDGPAPGEAWRRGRFEAPYLRDALLDLGVLVETLETTTLWSRLPELRAGLTAALQEALADGSGAPVIVMGHVSHVYAEGASLYLTVVARGGDDPGATATRWAGAKRAAGDAIAARGASITHHHAVGTDHAPWMTDEIGPLGVEVVRAVQARLDPAGVMNPGKLLPG